MRRSWRVCTHAWMRPSVPSTTNAWRTFVRKNGSETVADAPKIRWGFVSQEDVERQAEARRASYRDHKDKLAKWMQWMSATSSKWNDANKEVERTTVALESLLQGSEEAYLAVARAFQKGNEEMEIMVNQTALDPKLGKFLMDTWTMGREANLKPRLKVESVEADVLRMGVAPREPQTNTIAQEQSSEEKGALTLPARYVAAAIEVGRIATGRMQLEADVLITAREQFSWKNLQEKNGKRSASQGERSLKGKTKQHTQEVKHVCTFASDVEWKKLLNFVDRVPATVPPMRMDDDEDEWPVSWRLKDFNFVVQNGLSARQICA